MRAKIVNSKCAVFDLDDTLIKSEGLVYVYEDDKFTKTLTPQEFTNYKKKPNEILDFTDFRDGNLIINAPKYKAWHILEKLYDEGMEIYILTGRNESLKPSIFKLFLNNNINIDLDHIMTIGDNKGEIDIAKEKKKILKRMSVEYDEILFFDDDTRNIKFVSLLPHVKTHLIK
jgi:FMN phosphatase YigB (HAD superfamily)